MVQVSRFRSGETYSLASGACKDRGWRHVRFGANGLPDASSKQAGTIGTGPRRTSPALWYCQATDQCYGCTTIRKDFCRARQIIFFCPSNFVLLRAVDPEFHNPRTSTYELGRALQSFFDYITPAFRSTTYSSAEILSTSVLTAKKKQWP